MAEEDVVRVLLSNQRDIVRRGLRAALEDSEDLVVVAERAALEPGTEVIRDVKPDVAVLDAMDGDTAAPAVRDELGDIPVVVVGHDYDATRRVALAADAGGFLLDDARESDVRDTVGRTARGEAAGSRDPADSPAAWRAGLTLREAQVLNLIAEGLTNREIGTELGLAEKTVKNYTSTLFAKLHIEHRTQAVIYRLAQRTDTADQG